MMETPEQRSRTMRAVKGSDTIPELAVRRLAHRMGFRFRLHRKDLPGKPDLVFPRLHKVVFVHGCFWHGHDCPRGARVPVRNRDYWRCKVAGNQARDRSVPISLQAMGWESLVIWECETKTARTLENRLKQFLSDPVADEDRAAVVELARKQFESEGYGPDGEKKNHRAPKGRGE